ncbi:MAG: hypothetical protein ACI3Z9_04475 [Candidatus Onthomorpha sp.]
MKKVMLFFAAVFAAFCFSSCEEEKEDTVDVQQVYYRLHSAAFCDHEDIYIFEYDKNDKIVQESYILNLGRGEHTEYRLARLNASYVVIYCRENYHSDFDGSITTYYTRTLGNIEEQYNEFWLDGEYITQEEFEAMKEQKK